jgi:hypothetical protein
LLPLLLDSAVSLIESTLQAEGSAVIQYLEDEPTKLKSKYATVAPSSAEIILNAT